MKLFGLKRRRLTPPPYTFDGFRLSHNLVSGLELPGWGNGMRTFSETERAAMAKALVDFQREANERYGEEAHFNAEIIPELKRRLGATALEELARAEWQESREKAGCWKSCIATYLKAWADNLNPWTLIEITEILIYEGYKGEAKRVLNVLKQFPEYARAQKNDGFSSDEWVAKLQKRIDDISKDFDL